MTDMLSLFASSLSRSRSRRWSMSFRFLSAPVPAAADEDEEEDDELPPCGFCRLSRSLFQFLVVSSTSASACSASRRSCAIRSLCARVMVGSSHESLLLLTRLFFESLVRERGPRGSPPPFV